MNKCTYCTRETLLPSELWATSTICSRCWQVAVRVDDTILYVPTFKQEEFHACNQPNVLFWGGRGSGKSKALRWDAHLRALSTPGFKYLILRRTYPELEKSHLLDIPKEMKLLGGTYHTTAKRAFYPNGSMGFFSHCQSEDDVLNLLSAEFHWMGFDEISTFEWDMFTRLAVSVRVLVASGLTAMVRAATNPLGCSAEHINRYFVLKDLEPDEDPDYNPLDWHEIHANIGDNPHVDKEQYKKRYSGLAAHVRKAWVDGEFALENALFDFRPTVDGHPYHIISDISVPDLIQKAQIYRAYDHGYFPDPAYCIWIAHLGNRYIAFHEKLWYKTIVSDIAEDIKLEDEMLGIKNVNITYCDPTIDIHTGADIRTIKEMFEIHGIAMENSINKRDLYASHVHTALYEQAEVAHDLLPGIPRLQIYVRNKRIGCPYLAKTLPLQRYNLKKPLFLDDHPDDHATVALAYFLISSGSMERQSATLHHGFRPWMIPKPQAKPSFSY